jgi:hypothetical protein
MFDKQCLNVWPGKKFDADGVEQCLSDILEPMSVRNFRRVLKTYLAYPESGIRPPILPLLLCSHQASASVKYKISMECVWKNEPSPASSATSNTRMYWFWYFMW